jgi:endoglucanase
MKKTLFPVLVLLFSAFSSLNAAVLKDWSGFMPGLNNGVYMDAKGSTISVSSVKYSGSDESTLKIDSNIVEWAGIWALAQADLSRAGALAFYAKTGSPVVLQAGITDRHKIQYVCSVPITPGEWKKYVIPIANFSQTIYPDPAAPKNTSIDLSSIQSIQFQPLGRGAIKINIGKVTIEDPSPARALKSEVKDQGNIKTHALPQLRVRGNRFVDTEGKTIVLKGLCLGDPADVRQNGYWSADYFRQASLWGAKLVRIPISPGTYRALGKDAYFDLITEAVNWSEKYGMYVMLDWHPIGNPVKNIFLDPENSLSTTIQETKEFWTTAAKKYKDRPSVAFYEIFNEPAAITWKGGTLNWEEWKNWADEVIDAVYAANPAAIPVVGGLDFAYNFRDMTPLRNKGIAFAVHPYPGHSPQPWEENWEKDFGFLAKDYPVILSEFGFDPEDKIQPKDYKADTVYGNKILDFAKARGMSWTAFTFCDNPGWPMPLFSGRDYKPTVSGQFFRDALLQK